MLTWNKNFLYNHEIFSVSWKRMKYLDIKGYLKFTKKCENSFSQVIVKWFGLRGFSIWLFWLFSPALRSLASTDNRAVETCILWITSRLHTRVHTKHVPSKSEQRIFYILNGYFFFKCIFAFTVFSVNNLEFKKNFHSMSWLLVGFINGINGHSLNKRFTIMIWWWSKWLTDISRHKTKKSQWKTWQHNCL